MNPGFLGGLLASVLVNLATLPSAWLALRGWCRHRQIKWLWGVGRPVVVTFSAITDVDNPEIYSSRRAFTHIGDAQAAALAQRLVDSTRKEKSALGGVKK